LKPKEFQSDFNESRAGRLWGGEDKKRIKVSPIIGKEVGHNKKGGAMQNKNI